MGIYIQKTLRTFAMLFDHHTRKEWVPMLQLKHVPNPLISDSDKSVSLIYSE